MSPPVLIVSEQLNYTKPDGIHAIFMPVIIEFSRYIRTYSSAKFEEIILKLASLIGAMGVIGGFLIAIYKFYQKPHETEKKLKKLQELHMDDMKKINEEQCLITYGLLACLKGLQEQGCNGPVTEAINRIQKHLNKQAHDMEE